MYGAILVATDGSAAAERAGAAAVELADRFDATLHAVHVLEIGELPPGVEDEYADEFATTGTEAIREVESRAEAAGVATTSVVLDGTGPVHGQLVEYAEEAGVDLVVVGTAGRTGLDRVVLGSVAERTIGSAPVPVLTVHEDTPLSGFETVVVATDGSAAAERAAEEAIRLAAASGAELHAVSAAEVPIAYDGAGPVLDALSDAGDDATAAVAGMAEDAGLEAVTRATLTGRPHRVVVDYAESVDASLVVVGTHGGRGLDRLLLGSVAERVVRTARVPVLAVR